MVEQNALTRLIKAPSRRRTLHDDLRHVRVGRQALRGVVDRGHNLYRQNGEGALGGPHRTARVHQLAKMRRN